MNYEIKYTVFDFEYMKFMLEIFEDQHVLLHEKIFKHSKYDSGDILKLEPKYHKIANLYL